MIKMNFFKKTNYEDKILNEQWIEHYFALPMRKPIDRNHSEFLAYLEGLNEKIISFVLTPSLGLFEIGKNVTTQSYQYNDLPEIYSHVLQFLNVNKDTYFMLIRFIDQKKSDAKEKIAQLRWVLDNKRGYKFSPLQSSKIAKICQSIEQTLIVLTGIRPHQMMTLITGIGEEIVIHEFDGLQYHSYSLSKRAELYKKYPKIDKKLFGWNFVEFIRWILEKEKESEDMKRNCERTRKIVSNFDIKT